MNEAILTSSTKRVIQHGTRNTYQRHGCRCDECRAENAARSRVARDKDRDYFRESDRKSYAKNREARLETRRASFDSEKNRARCAVRRAVDAGVLVRGDCEVGGDCLGAVQAHHDDYSNPLDVRWLCKRHHTLHHLSEPHTKARRR